MKWNPPVYMVASEDQGVTRAQFMVTASSIHFCQHDLRAFARVMESPVERNAVRVAEPLGLVLLAAERFFEGRPFIWTTHEGFTDGKWHIRWRDWPSHLINQFFYALGVQMGKTDEAIR